MTQEEIIKMEKKALEQFTTGKSLFGKDGAFAPLLQSFLNKALEAEMQAHLNGQERSKGNKRWWHWKEGAQVRGRHLRTENAPGPP